LKRVICCLLVALAACTTGGETDSTGTTGDPVTTDSPTSTTVTEPPVREGSDDPREGVTVTRQEAEQIALDAVGSGTVTWSGPEDDRGAAWEVEVTLPDGSEVDVLIAADGTVIKIVGKAGTPGAPTLSGPGSTSGRVVTLAEAEAAALAHVGEGAVTWSGREDERGAAWELEVTRPVGSEFDVLIAADGSVVP
jgi:hypothetical protein